MAEYFDEFVDIRGKYLRKPIEQTTKVTKIKVSGKYYAVSYYKILNNDIKYV